MLSVEFLLRFRGDGAGIDRPSRVWAWMLAALFVLLPSRALAQSSMALDFSQCTPYQEVTTHYACAGVTRFSSDGGTPRIWPDGDRILVPSASTGGSLEIVFAARVNRVRFQTRAYNGTPDSRITAFNASGVEVTHAMAPLNGTVELTGPGITRLVFNPDDSWGIANLSYDFETATFLGCTGQCGRMSTAVSITNSSGSSLFGEPVTFVATVQASPALGGSAPALSGSVTFTDTSTVPPTTLATVPLANGLAALTTSALAIGTRTIEASYGGDVIYEPAKGSRGHVVGRASAAVSLTSSVATSVFGQGVELTATVTSGPGSVTGTVTFSHGESVLGTVALVNGVASLTASSLPPGAYDIEAAYSGDANHAPSSSTAALVVERASTATSLLSSSNPAVLGSSVTVTTLVTVVAPGEGAPGGSVTFSRAGQVLGVSPLSEDGRASFVTTNLAAGVHALQAAYSGDDFFAPSTASLDQSIDPLQAVVGLASSLNPSRFDDAVTFVADVSGAQGTPTGSVTFSRKVGAIETPLGSAPLVAGRAEMRTSDLPVGSYAIVATYGGDAIYLAGSTGAVVQRVTRVPTTVALFSSVDAAAPGQLVTFTVTVVSPVASATGDVELFAGDASLGKAKLSATSNALEASAILSTDALPAGVSIIRAEYAGDANHEPAVSPTLEQTVQTALGGRGCGCQTIPRRTGAAASWMLVGLGVLLAHRRRARARRVDSSARF